jgi:hypothetical protein
MKKEHGVGRSSWLKQIVKNEQKHGEQNTVDISVNQTVKKLPKTGSSSEADKKSKKDKTNQQRQNKIER